MMILIIINLLILFILSICMFNAADECDKSLRYRADYYDKDEYFNKKFAVGIYYTIGFFGLILTLIEVLFLLIKL